MNDLISRKALLEAIKDVEVAWYLDGNYTTYDDTTIMDIIEEQPSMEFQTWIPCSERMPTEKEAWEYNADENLYEPNEFIVQVKGAKLPTVAMFDGETFIHRYAENGYGFIGEIIAWQPLPEPYKGEQHETD